MVEPSILAIPAVLILALLLVAYRIKKAREKKARNKRGKGPDTCLYCGWTVPPWFTGAWWLSYCPDCDRDLRKT